MRSKRVWSPTSPRLHALLLHATLACLGCSETDSARVQTKPTGSVSKLNDVAKPAKKDKAPTRLPSLAAPLPPLPQLPSVSDLTFEVRNESLWVKSPLLGTSLSERAHEITKTTIQGNEITILFEDQFACVHKKTLHKELDYFRARLENTRAFRVYKEGKFAEAARGFERAMGLDPDYEKARTNYIATLCRAGELAAAKTAFKASLLKDPVSTYEKLLADEDFSPLRAEFRTKVNVEPVLHLVDKDLKSYAGYSKRSNLLSVVRKEASWGSESWTAELHVFDARTQKRVSQHTLLRWQDTNEEGHIRQELKSDVEARLRRLSEALTALEFVALPETFRGEFNQLAPATGKVEAPLPGLGKSIVADSDVLELRSGDRILETFHSKLRDARPSQIYAVPALNSLIYFGAYEVAEGCDSGPETQLEVFATTHLGSAER